MELTTPTTAAAQISIGLLPVLSRPAPMSAGVPCSAEQRQHLHIVTFYPALTVYGSVQGSRCELMSLGRFTVLSHEASASWDPCSLVKGAE